MAENEDIPYNAPEFATEDAKTEDPDQPNKSVLLEVQAYLDEIITVHSSIDVIDLAETHKMTPTQQISVHQQVVKHLRDVKSTIDNKLKELI